MGRMDTQETYPRSPGRNAWAAETTDGQIIAGFAGF